METTNNKEEVRQMLEDVRRAHRLLYSYQNSVLHLIKQIHNCCVFPNYPAGRKLFSQPLHNTELFSKENKKANLQIEEKWAWDFLYSYEMEYYFGKKSKDGLTAAFSVFQISDNGYYLRDGHDFGPNHTGLKRCDVEKFWDAAESQSYFIFVVECCKNQNLHHFPSVWKSVLGLYGGENDELCVEKDESILVVKRYPMESFFDRDSTLDSLQDFADLVREKTSVNDKKGFDLLK